MAICPVHGVDHDAEPPRITVDMRRRLEEEFIVFLKSAKTIVGEPVFATTLFCLEPRKADTHLESGTMTNMPAGIDMLVTERALALLKEYHRQGEPDGAFDMVEGQKGRAFGHRRIVREN